MFYHLYKLPALAAALIFNEPVNRPNMANSAAIYGDANEFGESSRELSVNDNLRIMPC